MSEPTVSNVRMTVQPTGQDLICLVCRKQAQDIDHVVNRGMGGSKARDIPENKVPLCRECHELKTVGRIKTRIVEGCPMSGGLCYEWWKADSNLKICTGVEVSQRYKCLVGRFTDGAEEESPLNQPAGEDAVGYRPSSAPSLSPDASEVCCQILVTTGEHIGECRCRGQVEGCHSVLSAAAEAAKPGSTIKSGRGDEGEASPTSPRDRGGDVTPSSVITQPSAAAPSAGSQEESDGTESGAVRRGAADMGIPSQVSATPTRRSVLPGVLAAHERGDNLSLLTHEQRVVIAQEIKDTEWNRQWFAGDTGNAWIAELGEEAEQYLSDFGYVQESLANILRVCEKIPPPYRNGNLRYSHHVVVAGENLEDVEMHLAECEEKQWSVAEFRRQRKGTKPKVKRWSMDELRERWDGFWYIRDQNDPKWDTDSRINIAFAKFLDWLSAEEQG